MALLKPEQLTSQIRSGKFGSVYLFDGPEAWLKERALNQILSKVLTDQEKELNFDRFDGNTCSGADIVNAAQSMPFLSKKRVVLVSSTEELSAKETKVVGEIIPSLPDSTLLIFFYDGKAPLRQEIPAQVGSVGSIVTFWTPFPNQMPMWVANEAKSRGKNLSYDAARTLAEACTDLQEISNELDKLFLFCGKKTQVTLQDVLQHGLPDGSGDYADLEEAIWSRNLSGALRQSQLMFEMGVRAEALFPAFERVFRSLILARYYLDVKKMGRMDLYQELRLRGKTRQNQLDNGLRRYTRDELKDSLEKIIQANMDLKTGRLSTDMAVSLLILGLLGKKEEKVLAFG